MRLRILKSSPFFFKVGVSFLILMGLNSCQFEPLYQKHSQTPIKINTISSRDGQILRNYLIELIEGSDFTPHYTLNVSISSQIRNLAYNRDGTASRLETNFEAQVELQHIRSKKIIWKDKISLDSSHSTIKDAPHYFYLTKDKEYHLEALAQEIKLRLDLFLSQYKTISPK